jgi:predicted nucleic acid-binding protein
MKIVDTNVLLYAVSERSAHHASARGWLTQALHGPEVIGMPWVTLLGFIRISTHPRVFPRPLRPLRRPSWSRPGCRPQPW